MAKKREFYFKSCDGVNRIHTVEWSPEDGVVRAVLHIVHGMAERVERYDDFARFMADKGYLVVGDDHLGHGKTAAAPTDFGYIGEDGAHLLVKDEHRLQRHMKQLYPVVPYIILGHSMGSYITRRFISIYGDDVDACLILGTGFQSAAETGAGLTIAGLIGRLRGERHRSDFLTELGFGKYCARIENPRTESDWLSRDEKVVDDFKNDPLCDFIFTVDGFKALLTLVREDCDDRTAQKVPKELPIYILSGAEDPVGQYGEGVMKTYEQYKQAGIENLQVKIYPEMRHEILNELGKEEVYEDILRWTEERISEYAQENDEADTENDDASDSQMDDKADSQEE